MSDPLCTGTKFCKRCEQHLAVLCFASNKAASDGLYTYCRSCQSERNKLARPKVAKPAKHRIRFSQLDDI